LDLALCLEQGQVVQVQIGFGEAHVLAGLRPLFQWGTPVQAAVGGVVVLALCVLGTYVAPTQQKLPRKHFAW
jgi:hypothetical protein